MSHQRDNVPNPKSWHIDWRSGKNWRKILVFSMILCVIYSGIILISALIATKMMGETKGVVLFGLLSLILCFASIVLLNTWFGAKKQIVERFNKLLSSLSLADLGVFFLWFFATSVLTLVTSVLFAKELSLEGDWQSIIVFPIITLIFNLPSLVQYCRNDKRGDGVTR